jgi:hypothetical protein
MRYKPWFFRKIQFNLSSTKLILYLVLPEDGVHSRHSSDALKLQFFSEPSSFQEVTQNFLVLQKVHFILCSVIFKLSVSMHEATV